jgi:beta-1,4-mannooligosaccharide/beta-1,4-mannosyl-N-acetylglucosamine phosphorylase
MSLIQRHPQNPLLRPSDAPYHCSLLFNAGIAKFQGRYVMIFRNDYGANSDDEFEQRQRERIPRFDGTNLGLAYSEDGIQWEIQPEPCITLEKAHSLIAPLMPGKDPEVELKRFYDPRLTVVEGRLYMCFAIDTAHGLRGGVAVTDDLTQWEVLSASVPDNRNMVLFPEKIGGRFCRYERSVNTFGGNKLSEDQAMMWMSFSPDVRHWGDSRHVLATESIPFANSKMGPGAPPIRTEKGWLTTFHAVERDDNRGKNGWERNWPKIYRAGLMLTDLENPSLILGMCREPLLSPETWYETGGTGPDGESFNGFRNHVIFPGGMILEESGEVKIYYGAADTVECLATADVGDLLNACLQQPFA